jgi:hypothetical protein
MSSKHFRDGSYNPAWPMDWPTVAAVLTIGGGGGSYTGITFDDIRLTLDGAGWIAEADDSGRTWRGYSESSAGATLALLADRIGLSATVMFKPDAEEADRG